MAVTAFWYGNAFISAFNKEIDFDTDTIKVALMFSTFASVVPDDQRYFDVIEVSQEQVAGTGYTAGGEVLANKALTYNPATNTIKLDGDDVVWPNSTITARYAVIYDDTPATNKPLLCYVDFGQDMSSANGNFSITWDAAGIATVTVS